MPKNQQKLFSLVLSGSNSTFTQGSYRGHLNILSRLDHIDVIIILSVIVEAAVFFSSSLCLASQFCSVLF